MTPWAPSRQQPGLAWFFAYRFTSACLPYLPVATACFLARGLTMSQILVLSAVYFAGTALLGIPLARLADRWGYRRALVVGAGALALGAAFAALAHGHGVFIAAQIALAAGAALDSGTDSAYLFQHLDRRGATLDEYRRHEARSASVKLLGNVVGFALGGLLATWSPALPFAAGALFAALAALCATRLDDAPRAVALRRGARLAHSVRTLFAASDLRRLLVLAALCAAMARVALSTAAPYLASLDVTLVAIGLLTAAGAVGASIAARSAVPLCNRFGDQTLLAALPIALLACIIALGVGAGAAIIALALLPQVLSGLHGPVWRSHLNARIADSSCRATVLAIDGTVARLLCAGVTTGLAALTSDSGPRGALVACAAIAAAILVGLALLPSRGSRRMRAAWAASGIAALVLLRGPVSSAVADPAARPTLITTHPIEVEIDPTAAGEPAAPAAFLGSDDDAILERLCGDTISSLEPLGQGSTVKFKARFTGDLKAAVRPAQSLAAGNFRADIAAYRLSRELGLGTVPPSCARTMKRAALDAAAGPALEKRLADEVRWSKDGATASVTYWVKGVKTAELEKNRRAWSALLAQEADLEAASPRLVEAAAEGSRLLVWDFLIGNWDRWSGANTFRLGDDGPFVWLDNAAGFGNESARSRARRAARLDGVERYSRQLVGALRAASDDDLRGALEPAGLSDRAIGELLERRRLILARVDALVAEHGDAAVLAFD